MFSKGAPRRRKKRRQKRAADAPLRVVGYCRVSTTMQADAGASLKVQEDGIEAYCRARGYDLIETVKDAGVSGRISPSKRDGFAHAVALLDDDCADGLIVYKLDRLSRSVNDAVMLAKEFGNRSYHLIGVCDAIDTTSPMGTFFFHMMSALAEMESARTGERVRDGMRKKSEDMKCMSRYTPFGWRLESADGPWEAARRLRDSENQKCGEREQRRLVANPEEQKLLAEIMRLHASGKSAYQIAVGMNDGKQTHPRSKKPWQAATIVAITKTAEKKAQHVAAYDAFKLGA